WIELGEMEEPMGLSLEDRPQAEGLTRLAEVEGRPCRATDIANRQFYMNFVAAPQFAAGGPNTVAITLEYLDNGNGPIYLQYSSAPGGFPYRMARPIRRTDTGEWKKATWQVADPKLGTANGVLEFRFHGEGWHTPDHELYVASVRVTREVIRIEPTPSVLPADGESKSRVSLLALDPAGDPIPDGSEVAIRCLGATAPEAVQTIGGRAEFEITAGDAERTLRIKATHGGLTREASVYQVAGQGEIVPFTQICGADVIRSQLEPWGGNKTSMVISDPGDQEDPELVEMKFTFPPNANPPRVLVSLRAPIIGKPFALRAQVGGDGTLDSMLVLLEDAKSEQLLYALKPYGTKPLKGEAVLDVSLDECLACYGRAADYVPDLPLRWRILSFTFTPGTTEASVRLRRLEADVLATESVARAAASRSDR
ncbi:MAG: hypothetical protein ACE5R4_10510, partial [Armatimonadota bacterium]